jgi:uncharacterized membrane protein HdeD (DUF308 family)
MRFLREKGGRLTAFLGEILVGVLLIVEPVKFTSVVIIAAGVLMCALAALNIVRYFKADAKAAAVSRALYKGLTFAFFGLFCIFFSGWFIDTFPIVSIIYGICIMLAGFSKVQWTVDAIRVKSGSWIPYAVSAAVTVICAVIILCNPFGTVKALWLFAGISLIAEAVMDIVSMFIKGKEAPAEIIVEGVAVDETEA